jgi:hypothetical protein
MRHSDPKLTTKIYTDVGMLPIWDAVGALPMFSDTELDAVNSVQSGQVVSTAVTMGKNNSDSLGVGAEVISASLTTPVLKSAEDEEIGPARIRTWDQGIMSPLLYR